MKSKSGSRSGRPGPRHRTGGRQQTPPRAPRRNARTDTRTRAPETVAEGIFAGTKTGYGFVTAEGVARDVFIPREKTGGALDGDRVLCRYHTYTSAGIERTEGEVTRVTEAVRKTVVGTLCEELFGHGKHRSVRYFVEPDDTKLTVLLYLDDIGDARLGDKVEALLPPRRPGSYFLVGQYLRSFGAAASREANYAAILSECAIPTEFTREEIDEAERIAKMPLSPEGRVDRRDEVIFTIDGAGAKDLDDAVSLRKKKNGNYLLGVHIADVSTYVRAKGALDACSLSRGTSVYFTDKVVPMLPEALSNGACSLNAGEDKYALSCLMELTPDGAFVHTAIERSIIRSAVRGVYSEVNDLFEKGRNSPFAEKYSRVLPTLRLMHGLYLTLAEKSRRRGALDLEQTEAEILLDAQGNPTDILPRVRGDAEKLIEQFMLAANEAVATLLADKHLPCVYRVHEAPDPDRLADFITFAHNLDLDTTPLTARDPDGRAFSALLDSARERGIGDAVSYTLLRTMAKAHYSEVCHPHFGLGIEKYCHFTSPIRRLSDLATHRAIEAVLLDGEAPQKYYGYVRRAALAASETEVRAMTAERRIDALYKTIYLSKRIGETYPATVSSVTRFGVFAALDNTCEGLIPLTALPGMWTFDEGNLMLRASSGETLRLGDKITVSVDETDITRGKVTFGLVSLPGGAKCPTPPPAPDATPAPDRFAKPMPRTGKKPRGGTARSAGTSDRAAHGKKTDNAGPTGTGPKSGNPRGGKSGGKKPQGGRRNGKSGGHPKDGGKGHRR